MAKSEAEQLMILYVGTHCHLCELARAILDEVVGSSSYREITISDDPALMETYGIRIPVVKAVSGQEKGWPFTAGQVRRML